MTRTSQKFLLLLAAVSAFANAGISQEKLLPPTYQTGKNYEMEMSQNIKMDMTAMAAATGQPAGKMTMDMTMGMALDCQEHTTAGQRAVTTTFTKVITDMDMGVMKMSYDSTDPDSAGSPLAAGMGPLLDLEIVTILDENDEVVEVQGVDQLAGVQGMDIEQFKQMSNPAAQLGIPETGVAVGEKWENTMKMPMGQQAGSVAVKMNLEYVEDETVDGKTLAVVKYTGTLDVETQAEENSPIEVGVANMEGSMRFDKANRVLVDGTGKGAVEMSMPNPGGGDALTMPMEFDQEFTMTEVEG